VRLVQPAFGSDAALVGAAEVAFGDLLADPLGAATRSMNERAAAAVSTEGS
jgi:hypothetical protein